MSTTLREQPDWSPCRKLSNSNTISVLEFSRTALYSDAVNVVATKSPSSGEPQFELIKDVDAKTELVCFFVPERPEEAAFLLPAIQYLRHTLFKKLVDNVLEDSPLDLSPKVRNSTCTRWSIWLDSWVALTLICDHPSTCPPAQLANFPSAQAEPGRKLEQPKSKSTQLTDYGETGETLKGRRISLHGF